MSAFAGRACSVHLRGGQVGCGESDPEADLDHRRLAAGADCIDDLDVIRTGVTKRLFDGVYAPTTLGTLLREFTGGHVRQLQAVQRRHLVALADRTGVLAGIDERAFVDIDSLLRPVYGHEVSWLWWRL